MRAEERKKHENTIFIQLEKRWQEFEFSPSSERQKTWGRNFNIILIGEI